MPPTRFPALASSSTDQLKAAARLLATQSTLRAQDAALEAEILDLLRDRMRATDHLAYALELEALSAPRVPA